MRNHSRPTALLHALFFLSGAVALIYEVVWTRWLTGLLGSESAATAIVLSVFMAGLGLGSWLSSRFADRVARPIRIYALMEFGVAALAMLPLWEMRLWTGVFEKLAQWQGPVSPLHDVLRFVLAAIAVGPPAVLMGASFPLIVRALATSGNEIGRRTATAYAVNSFGGAVGTLLVGFFLIENVGLRGTCLIAFGIAVVVAAAAFLLDLRTQPNVVDQNDSIVTAPRSAAAHGQIVSRQQTARASKDIASRLTPTWILVAAAVSGFCALGYETIWSRVLSVHTLNTTYAFCLMLAILLCGLSLGSWMIRGRLDRLQDSAAWFVAIQILLALYVLASLLWIPQIVQIAQWLVPGGESGGLAVWFGRPLVVATGLLLIPTMLMGASLPVVCKLYASVTPGIAQPVGRTVAANTWGSVLGPLAIGLVVIPWLGTWWAAALCAAVGGVSAVAVAQAYIVPNRRLVWTAAASTAVVFAVSLGVIHGGTFITQQGHGSHDTVVFWAEDEYGLVEVTEDKHLGTRWMLTNRLHWEGSTLPRAVAQQRKQGLLPLILHPSPRRVLEIGLGTGIKLCSLESPIVDEAVVVEISPGVIQASQWFANYNRHVGSEHSKVQIVRADARNFTALTPRTFDVIVNGLLTPYHAGVSRLYTVEHFRTCHTKLAADGMFVVWVAIRQIAPDDLRVLTRTLLDVFPHTTMWLDGYYLAFVSTKQPVVYDAEEILRRCASDDLATVLGDAGLNSPAPVLATFVAGPQTLAQFADNQPRNTEDRPIIEFRTPRLGDRLNSAELAAEILGTLSMLQEPLSPGHVKAHPTTRQRLLRAQQARYTANQALIQKCYGNHIEAATLFQQAIAEDSTDDLARYEMEMYLVAHGKQCVERGLIDQAVHVFRQAVRVNSRSIGALASLATLEENAGNHEAAYYLWQRALALDPHNRPIRERIANTNNGNASRKY